MYLKISMSIAIRMATIVSRSKVSSRVLKMRFFIKVAIKTTF